MNIIIYSISAKLTGRFQLKLCTKSNNDYINYIHNHKIFGKVYKILTPAYTHVSNLFAIVIYLIRLNMKIFKENKLDVM